jgi:FAD-linked sulfhydryl oxidase
MSENPVQALFHNFEQVANFVQHHVSNFIGNPPGPSGRGSVKASIKVPFANTTSFVQPIDTVLKVSIINGLQS